MIGTMERVARRGSHARRTVMERSDAAVIAFGRSITRRKFLQTVCRGALGAGALMFTPAGLFQGKADAALCGPGGVVSTWGTTCASTASCPSSKCSNGNCSGIAKRCNYWTSANAEGNYCWCSLSSCNACNARGYYTCCDCWSGSCTSGCSGGCNCGNACGRSKCVCKRYNLNGCCSYPCCN